MATYCRNWCRNCALEADAEILAFDRMEEHIAPLEHSIRNSVDLRIFGLEACFDFLVFFEGLAGEGFLEAEFQG